MQTGDVIDPAFYSAGGGITTSAQGANFTAVAANRYIITASSLTATLPAAPAQGDTVYFVAATSSITGTIIARNALNIMSLAQDMTVDIAPFFFALTYYDATQGWRIT